MQVDSILTLLGLLITLAAFYFPYRASIRRDKAQKLKDAETGRREAIEAAVKPVREDLDRMTDDRDYWRDMVLTKLPGTSPVSLERRPKPNKEN